MNFTCGNDGNRDGFTLVEMMIALALLSVVSLIMFNVFSSIFNISTSEKKSANIQIAMREVNHDYEKFIRSSSYEIEINTTKVNSYTIRDTQSQALFTLSVIDSSLYVNNIKRLDNISSVEVRLENDVIRLMIESEVTGVKGIDTLISTK